MPILGHSRRFYSETRPLPRLICSILSQKERLGIYAMNAKYGIWGAGSIVLDHYFVINCVLVRCRINCYNLSPVSIMENIIVLILYGTPLSSPANKIRFLLNYLAIPYEYKTLDLAAGDHKQADFLKINPYGKVPAIDDNGFKLAESNAILRYLADKHPSSLYPKNLEERAVVEQWLDFAANHISLATSKVMYNTYFYRLMAGMTKDERSLQDGLLWLDRYLPILEQQLAKHPYIAGNQLTIADFSLLAALDAAELINIDLAPYPHLNTWRQQLMAESFYQDCYSSYAASFKQSVGALFEDVKA